MVTKTIIGESMFLPYKRTGIELYWLFSSTRTILMACFYCYTQTTLQRSQLLPFMLSKKNPTTHSQQKCYNHSLPFKLRNKRTSWCRYGYLAFHGQIACLAARFAFPWKWLPTAPRPGPSTGWKTPLSLNLLSSSEGQWPLQSLGLVLSSHYDTVTNLPLCKTHTVSQWSWIAWWHEVISLN